MKKLVCLVLALFLSLSVAAGLAEGYVLQDPNVNEPGVLPVVKEKITLTAGIVQSPLITSYEYGENYLTTHLEDLTNIHIDWVMYPATAADAYAKLRLQIAGGEKLPDILIGFDLGNDAIRESYGQAGAIIPLNDYLGKLDYFHSRAVAQTPEAQEGFDLWKLGRSLDGNYYGMMELYRTLPNSYACRAWYNEEFAKKLGLELEPGQVPDTEWLLKYLRGVRDEDVNGNGDPSDEIPMVGGTGWYQNVVRWIVKMYTYMDVTDRWFQVEDGILSNVYTKDAFREGLKFARQLYDEKLFPDYALTQDNTAYVALVSAETPIVGIGVSGSCTGFGKNLSFTGPVPVVLGPDGVGHATYAAGLPVFDSVITKDCKHPEAAFRWMDAWNYEQWFMLVQRWGIPDVDWRFAEEGEKGMYDSLGMDPYFYMIQSVWGVPSASHWAGEISGGVDYANINSRFVWDGNVSNNEYKNALAVALQVPYVPKEYVSKIIYSVEEQEDWANTRAAINNLVLERMAQFATGQMDIHDDAQWAQFQQELKDLGSEELLAMDQAAFNRTMGVE